MKDDDIKIKIAEVAKQEFLELGYVDASMRNISAKAGLTTGSLYNRFRDKAELFHFIVGESADFVFNKFVEFNNHYKGNFKGTVVTYDDSAIKFITGIMYENYDSFDLIINKGVGSPYEDYMDRIIAVADESSFDYVSQRMTDRRVAEDLTHLLNVVLFDSISELFRKHYTKAEADTYMQNIYKFYYSGWTAIIGDKL